jgi:fructose-1-phosphate kinase PfkB-like protein
VAGEPLRLAMAARPWLVKVNGDEAATVAGSGAEAPSTPDGALEAAQGLLLLGADTAIVTLGKAGAVWRAAERSLVLGAMPADMLGRFAVGSGDAFTAGLLAGLARGLPEADALQLAGGAGAANARTPGGGEFDPREAARNAARLQVEVIG